MICNNVLMNRNNAIMNRNDAIMHRYDTIMNRNESPCISKKPGTDNMQSNINKDLPGMHLMSFFSGRPAEHKY